ncbi:calcium/sodium antiporter [Kaarinaea lacus]
MLYPILAVVVGLVFLVWSADKFVMGASAVAHNLGVPTLIIGMIIMGFGTSAPEIFVAAIASLQHTPGIAVGNAIGSNIANIGLVLGIGAVIAPLTVSSTLLRREYPVLFMVTCLLLLLMSDLHLSNTDGIILLAATAAMLAWLLWLSATASRNHDPLENEFEAEMPTDLSTPKALIWTVFSLALLVGSSHILVWGAVQIATQFGVSELVIGLTIIAVGTSLPEVAVSISAALKKEHDIVLGNIVGSNMFNSLAVVGVASSIEEAPLTQVVLTRDFAVMFALTIAMFVIAYGFRGSGRINRFEGVLLLLGYLSYMGWLYISEIKA